MLFRRKKPVAKKVPSSDPPETASSARPAAGDALAPEILALLTQVYASLEKAGKTDGLSQAEFIEKHGALLAQPEARRFVRESLARDSSAGPAISLPPHRKGNGMLAESLPPHKQRRRR